MSDTLHEASKQFRQRLEQHIKRYQTDADYRKWFDSLDTKQKPIFPVGAW